MTFKKQLDIMGYLSKFNLAKTAEQISIIRNEIDIDLEKKIYVGNTVGQGAWTRYQLSEGILLLSNVLKVKSRGNDAPKGGQTGDYIIFANSRENKEIINFIDKLLSCMLECK